MYKEKRFLLTILIALFIVIFSMMSCPEPVNFLRKDKETIPQKMGSLSLLLGGRNNRTILPQIPVFQVYELEFTSNNANVTISRSIDTFSDPIHLLSGTYSLFITAYVDAEKKEKAAWGKENNIRIDEGKGVTHTIVLIPFAPDGEESGKFTWNISFMEDVTEARMFIKPLSENGAEEKEYYFEGAGGETPLNGSVSLESGFYSVLFTLIIPGFQTLEWLEILHIYPNLISPYVQNFNVEHFNNNNHTVTFVFNDGITGNVEQTYFHGDPVVPISPQPQPVRDGYTFGGWYTNTKFNERWDFSTPLNKSRTLYLRWLSETCSDAGIVGTFQGGITLYGFIEAGETIIQLFDDNTIRIQSASFPNYTFLANYSYNSWRKELQLSNIKIHASGMGKLEMDKLIGDIPNQITLPVSQWSMEDGIVIDAGIISGDLNSADDFIFSPDINFTEISLHIDYPDSSKSGKYVLTEVKFLDAAIPPITSIGILQGSRLTHKAEFKDDFNQGSSTRISVASYLFDSIDNLNTVLGFAASQPALLMSGSHIMETTDNPWQPPVFFTLYNGVGNQEFTVRFPNRLNIRMDHGNFTNNNPIISWDPYPGANGYFVLVTVRDKLSNVTNNRDEQVPAFYKHTMDTSVTISSHRISFTPVDTFLSILPPVIDRGDFIRIEVYALDYSGSLDTVNRTGALFMDSVTITR